MDGQQRVNLAAAIVVALAGTALTWLSPAIGVPVILVGIVWAIWWGWVRDRRATPPSEERPRIRVEDARGADLRGVEINPAVLRVTNDGLIADFRAYVTFLGGQDFLMPHPNEGQPQPAVWEHSATEVARIPRGGTANLLLADLTIDDGDKRATLRLFCAGPEGRKALYEMSYPFEVEQAVFLKVMITCDPEPEEVYERHLTVTTQHAGVGVSPSS